MRCNCIGHMSRNDSQILYLPSYNVVHRLHKRQYKTSASVDAGGMPTMKFFYSRRWTNPWSQSLLRCTSSKAVGLGRPWTWAAFHICLDRHWAGIIIFVLFTEDRTYEHFYENENPIHCTFVRRKMMIVFPIFFHHHFYSCILRINITFHLC